MYWWKWSSRIFQKDIRNTEKEIEFVHSLDIDAESKDARLKSLRTDLQRNVTRKESIEERLKEVTTKSCGICYEPLENPIYLSCSHMFCGQCILTWMQTNLRTRHSQVNCPECRTVIDSSKVVAIVKDKVDAETIPIILSKEDQLLDIIQKKPHGRFLVFSRMDTTFGRLSRMLHSHHITHSEIKGSTQQMMNILEDFKKQKIRVILL